MGSQIMLFDALGSTLGLLDANGVFQTEYTYEPFGATTATGAASRTRSNIQGGRTMRRGCIITGPDTTVPALRRFISEDPIGFGRIYQFMQPTSLSSPTILTSPRASFQRTCGLLDRCRKKRIERAITNTQRRSDDVEKI